MKKRSLFEEFKHFEGQPVRIFTDDEKVHCGIDVFAFEDSVRIINKCGQVELIDFDHIAAVAEPQMRLKCCRKVCKCDDDNDFDFDDDDDDDFDFDDDDDCDEEREEFRRRRRY